MNSYIQSHKGVERGKVYDQRYRSEFDSLYWTEFERPLLNRIFSDLTRENKELRYLDFASGTGRIIEIGSSYFINPTGIDVSSDMLSEARKKVPQAQFIEANVLEEEIDLGKFDVVSLFRFILNADHDLRISILKWIRKNLSNDAYLVVNNHGRRFSLWGVICSLSNLFKKKRVHNILSDRKFRKLMKECGFAIEKSYGFCVIPPNREKLFLNMRFTRRLEGLFLKTGIAYFFGKDKVYICRPSRL